MLSGVLRCEGHCDSAAIQIRQSAQALTHLYHTVRVSACGQLLSHAHSGQGSRVLKVKCIGKLAFPLLEELAYFLLHLQLQEKK